MLFALKRRIASRRLLGHIVTHTLRSTRTTHMARHSFQIERESPPAFDIVSYGRRGPGHPERFSPAQVAQIARTVRHAPEVMVKVSGGGNSARAVAAHFEYISRHGELEIETDDGELLQGKGAGEKLIDDWDLDIDAILDRSRYQERGGRVAQPKLVHNIILSMPAGTPPERLLRASQAFAREEFALQHRYAMALHTDQDHPHVHLVVSAHKREGGRLNIRKADLRRWREQFAAQLRHQGLAANATPVQVRGRLSAHRRDGRYRAEQRGESHVNWWKTERVAERASEASGRSNPERLGATNDTVRRDWRITAEVLHRQGLGMMANEVDRFRSAMVSRTMHTGLPPPPATTRPERVPQQLELTR